MLVTHASNFPSSLERYRSTNVELSCSLIPEIEKNVEGVKVEKEEDADPSDDEDLES